MVRLSDFDYDLPDELIAQTPLPDRAASRLLHLDPSTGEIHHRLFRDVIHLLNPGDVLVLNNTRVNAWRFKGKKPTGGEVEILCLKEIEPGVFESLIKPAKRLKPGATFDLDLGVTGTVLPGGDDPIRMVQLSCPTGNLSATLSQIGEMPLPPYITKKLDDSERYQTVFSQSNGSAAAPTAGLHFTQDILDQLIVKGVKIAYVTLHVGIDTFRPIQVDDVSTHQMHGEVCEISQATADIINLALSEQNAGINQRSSTEGGCPEVTLSRKGGGEGTSNSNNIESNRNLQESQIRLPTPNSKLPTPRIIAVGTTAVRTLESFANPDGTIASGRKTSHLFITPGYDLKIVDGMFTNFHFPRTTMLLMISALASREKILESYEKAIEEKYRFLSFGDSMLLLKS